jgi:hypothetical protein
MSVDVSNFRFRSSDHVRYQGGQDVSGHQKGNNRLIEIRQHPQISDAYLVTIYNLDGNHPFWANNVQMGAKRMRIVRSSDSIIELRGFGQDASGSSFEDYGITVNLKLGDVDTVVLHMYDRSVDIEYLK